MTSLFSPTTQHINNLKKVGFDGERVKCLPRFRRAINTATNVFNGGLQTISFTRTEKYNTRGFDFALPQFISIPRSRQPVTTTLARSPASLASTRYTYPIRRLKSKDCGSKFVRTEKGKRLWEQTEKVDILCALAKMNLLFRYS